MSIRLFRLPECTPSSNELISTSLREVHDLFIIETISELLHIVLCHLPETATSAVIMHALCLDLGQPRRGAALVETATAHVGSTFAPSFGTCAARCTARNVTVQCRPMS
jgi:hypothetical protein